LRGFSFTLCFEVLLINPWIVRLACAGSTGYADPTGSAWWTPRSISIKSSLVD